MTKVNKVLVNKKRFAIPLSSLTVLVLEVLPLLFNFIKTELSPIKSLYSYHGL